jgi:putative ABC transport system permease protein
VSGAIDIPLWRLGMAYALFFFVLFLTWRKRIHMGKDILGAVIRMTLQLLLMGIALKYIFRIQLWYIVTLIFFLMVFFAAHTIVKRSGITFRGIYRLLYVSILVGGGGVLLFFVLAVVHNQPWYAPRYFIPLAGMIIGNSMNGSALALERFYDDVKKQRSEIETRLSFGATAEEASRDSLRKAYRSALLPTLTSMTGMGLVFLPGMMTGQILGGSSPIVAIKYQIAIMGAILASVSLTGHLILTLESRQLFDKYHLPKEELFWTPT